MRTKGASTQCLQCGVVFSFSPSQKRKFCSLSCFSIHRNHKRKGYRNVSIICDHCGKVKVVRVSDLTKHAKRGLNRHFCSKQCASSFFKNTRRENTSKSLLTAYMVGRAKPSSHRGFRDDLGLFFRSTWEANVARVLTLMDIKWVYEPKAFPVKVSGEDSSYTPDFYLPDKDIFIEVKGYWFGKGKSKFDSFSEKYKTVLIDLPVYKLIQDTFMDGINWEGKVYAH